MSIKILCVSSFYKPAYVYGGSLKSTSLLTENMVKLGAKVSVLTTNANGGRKLDVPLGRSVDVDGVEARYHPLTLGGLGFFWSHDLAASITERVAHFDIVWIHNVWGHAIGAVWNSCHRHRVPYVVSLRGQLLAWTLGQKYWKKYLYLALVGKRYLNGAAALHCTDDEEKESLVRLNLRAPSFVIANPLEISHPSLLPARGTLRGRLGIPQDALVLLFLGRLHPKKRPHYAIDALAGTQDLKQEVHLVLVGPDETGMRVSLERQAQNRGCSKYVHFMGLLEGGDLLSSLVDADLFLMPSEPHSENFGRSAFEALATGVPVVATAASPIGRLVDKIGAGRSVEGDAAAFTHATRQLLENCEKLKMMGETGREYVIQRYGGPSVAAQMLEEFRRILSFPAAT